MFNVQRNYIHDDQVLSALSIKYENAEFTGKMFLPEYKVAKETGKYRIYDREGWFKGAPKKADGAITEEATLSYDEATYTCYERAIKDIVTDRAVQQADAPIQPKADTTEFLTEKVLLAQELDQWILMVGASGLLQSGYYTALTSSTAWSGGSAPSILTDLSTAIKAISLAIGKRPNMIAFTTAIAEAVAQDDKIVEIMKHHSTDMITGIGLPGSLRSCKIIITDSLYNTADQGLTQAFGYVLSDNIVCAYVDPRNKLTLGRTFVSKQNKVARWRDEDR
ncbi:MAG TPA: hypothetical protein VMW36_00920, partial [Patescibacteria group bacterium]|nr:hypothetical protein [Patescibacteria group bacterium]